MMNLASVHPESIETLWNVNADAKNKIYDFLRINRNIVECKSL